MSKFQVTFKGVKYDVTITGDSAQEIIRDFGDITVQLEKTLGSRNFAQVPSNTASSTTQSSDESVDNPVISPTNRTIANIEAIFAKDWGKSPRKIADIVNALAANAATDSTQAVSRDLGRLVHRGKLRRLKKDGDWTYFHAPGQQ